MTEPVVVGGDFDVLGPMQARRGSKLNAHRSEADDLLCTANSGLTVVDPRRDPAGKEMRKPLENRREIK